MKMKKFLKLFFPIAFLSVVSSVALSQTAEQKKHWAKFDTEAEIQNDIYNLHNQAIYCGSNTTSKPLCDKINQGALGVNCISKSIFNILKTKTFQASEKNTRRYYYFAQCGVSADDPDFLNPVMLAPCKCGCFIDGTKLLTQVKETETWKEIEKMMEDQDVVVALSDDGYIEVNKKPETQVVENPIYISSDDESQTHNVVKIDAVNATSLEKYQLTVTLSHPIVLHDGQMVVAADLTTDSKLIAHDGSEVNIIAIDHDAKYTGKVYNVDSLSENNIVFAEGLAVGDYQAQNEIDHRKIRILARQ